jgi:hypothetical protein
LFPEGYLALKYEFIDEKDLELRRLNNQNTMRGKLGYSIFDKTKEQIDKNQSFFEEEYLEYVAKKLREIQPIPMEKTN